MREQMFRCGIALSGNGSVYFSSLVNAVTYDVIRMLTVGGPGAFKLYFPLFLSIFCIYISRILIYMD